MPDFKAHPAVGIDLGTTFSAVAYLDSTGRPETIRNSEGDLTTPSAVFFDQSHPIVGVEAVEAGLQEPERLALYAKRDIGEDHYEKQIRNLSLPAELIQALVLRKLKSDAELKLGSLESAVITVPAFFNEPCRKATQDAGRLAGLNVLDIINEPTAAAITYGVQQGFLGEDGSTKSSETVLVYDLGGGTFDVTVMKIEGGKFETIATAGDVYLGGIDWDSRIVDFIAEAFLAEHRVDPRDDPFAMQELLRKANQTKHALTQRDSVNVAFAFQGKRLRTVLSQTEFSQRCIDLVERTIMTVQIVLDDAKLGWNELTRLILVGGSTRMPMVREELERLSKMTLDRSLSPDEAVCHGAALYAGMLLAKGEASESRGIGLSVSNVNSHDLGVLAVDPKTGKPRRQIMIPRNSKLPASRTVRFRTHSDGQANVKINIVEGGDQRGLNATAIGECIVDDLPSETPKGTHVDVRFDYSQDGRLTVHASLPQFDRQVTMTLDRAAGLSAEELESWTNRLNTGLSDQMLATLADSGEMVVGQEIEDAPELPGDNQKATAELISEVSVEPANVKPAVKDSPDPESVASAVNMKIDVGDQSVKPKLSSKEAAIILNGAEQTKPVAKKPKLNLDPKDEVAAVKADQRDFEQLAMLAGEKPKQSAEKGVPVIVTQATTKEVPRKKGRLFGRKG